jgi:non-ribosomal peptide synthetase component F
MMLVQEFLENSADHTPDKVGLICDGQRLTYAEIEAQANRLANGLTAFGLKRGERSETGLHLEQLPGQRPRCLRSQGRLGRAVIKRGGIPQGNSARSTIA